MDVFKKIATVSVLVSITSAASLLHAAPNDTSAQASNNQAIDDVAAITRVGQDNEAINDAVLGNDAINDGVLNNDAINPRAANGDDIAVASADDTASSNAPAPVPRTSSAQSVDADKLILNEPVVDQANILNPNEKLQLTAKLQNIYKQGLAQAAVVIVPTTNGVPIFDYALDVAEKWQLGREDVDDGLLILLAVNDREVYMLTGYGLEGVVPDAVANRIIREDMTPYFKQNDYAGGLMAGLDRIESRLTTDPEVLARADEAAAQEAANSDEQPSTIALFIIAFIFGTFLTQLLGRIFGSLVTAGGFFAGSLAVGGGFIITLILAIVLWLFLIGRRSGGGGKGGRGGRGGGGMIVVPGFGGGGGSGGGFGGGGFGGGGGGFGGGGAGGSW